jgi:Fe-S-cluster containining protein
MMPLPVQSRIDHLLLELQALRDYPDESFASVIQGIGFTCARCARCCTKLFKGHIYLLDHDVSAIRTICPGALIPAPYFDYCDQYGKIYTSGYVLRTREDGSCTFLDDVNCAIYQNRPLACQSYPFMLHREVDEEGNKYWRHFGSLDCHGGYSPISDDTAYILAREVKAYECEVIDHELRYLAFIRTYFEDHQLFHDRRVYDAGIREFLRGDQVVTMAYYDDTFEENQVQVYMY